jgi:hypothetical protein
VLNDFLGLFFIRLLWSLGFGLAWTNSSLSLSSLRAGALLACDWQSGHAQLMCPCLQHLKRFPAAMSLALSYSVSAALALTHPGVVSMALDLSFWKMLVSIGLVWDAVFYQIYFPQVKP